MIIWNGFGILVVVINGLCVAAITALAGQDPNRTNAWPVSVGLFIGAILITILGYYLRKQPGRTLIDPKTGQEVVFKRKDSLFFIPVIYWGPISLVFAIICLFTK